MSEGRARPEALGEFRNDFGAIDGDGMWRYIQNQWELGPLDTRPPACAGPDISGTTQARQAHYKLRVGGAPGDVVVSAGTEDEHGVPTPAPYTEWSDSCLVDGVQAVE